jgi:predicted nucleic acid-binding protein
MIIDTNALTAIADGNRGIGPLLKQADTIAIPTVVLGEYRFGIRQSRQRLRYERWLSELVSQCHILVVDEATAEQYAEIREELRISGHPIPSNDTWIAALVRQHLLPLLSRDHHFDFVSNITRVGW